MWKWNSFWSRLNKSQTESQSLEWMVKHQIDHLFEENHHVECWIFATKGKPDTIIVIYHYCYHGNISIVCMIFRNKWCNRTKKLESYCYHTVNVFYNVIQLTCWYNEFQPHFRMIHFNFIHHLNLYTFDVVNALAAEKGFLSFITFKTKLISLSSLTIQHNAKTIK